MFVQELDKVKQVGIIKRAMLKIQQTFEIGVVMVFYEVVRCIIHSRHQLFALVDDDCPVAPGEDGSKQASYFYVLFFSIGMWNTNRIIIDKRWPVVLFYFFIEKFYELGLHLTNVGG